jgi:hypothetical protein
MLEFLKFIWQSVLISSHIGFGVFFFIEAACVFIGAALLWKKHKAEKWEAWQELAMKTAFAILLILFIVSALFVAPFIQYRESDAAKNEQRASNATLASQIEDLKKELTEKDVLIQSNTIDFERELSANEDTIVFRYDDKFERMKKDRRLAATELLVHLEKGDMDSFTNAPDSPELDEVLGLFDDLGRFWKKKEVSDEILYQNFYDYMRTYCQPAEIYITATERDDPTAFENIKPLLDCLTQIDAEKSTSTVQKSIWSKADEITALKDEIELTK